MLENWIKVNNLSVEYISESLLKVENTDMYFYILGGDQNLFLEDVKKEIVFNISSEEQELILDLAKEYKGLKILFEFGSNFFYSEIKMFKDEFNDEYIKIDFNDFLYLGESPKESFHQCLAVHSEYELLNSALNFTNACKKAKFLKHKSIGICDHNTLAGTLGFQQKAVSYGLKFIVGEEISVCYDYDESLSKQITYNLKMYVINEKGWDSLLSINKQINVHNKGFVHNIDVLDHSEGLVCVIDFSSNVFQDITDLKHYKSILNSYIENFGENLYFQLSSAIFSDDRVYLKCLNSLKFFLDNFHDTGVKIILLDDVYYLEESHAHCKDILNKIGGFTRHYSPNQFMKTSEETLQVIGEYFDDYDKFQNLINEGLESANKLVEICNYNIPIGEPKLPMFEIDGVELTKSESDNLLWDLCQIGMENIIYKKIPKSKHHIYEKRLKHEFDIISGAGFSDYFLILADVVDFANSNKVFVGPGRGSAAGSLLAYVIGVTLVDPIEYGLLFERFLNESRFKESFNYTVTLENNTVLSFTEGELVKMEDGSKIESNKLVEGDEVSSTYSV